MKRRDPSPSSRRRGEAAGRARREPPSRGAPPPQATPTRPSADPSVLPRFDFRVEVGAATARGDRHARNEDAILCRPDLALFAIADGLGRHAAGELAARTALGAAEEHLGRREARALVDRYAAEPGLAPRRAVFALLLDAVRAADRAVRAAGAADEAHAGLGTTLDLALLCRDRAFVAHVGDARVYLVRPTVTLQLTHDHSFFDPLRTTGKRRARGAREPAPLVHAIGHGERPLADALFVDLGAGDHLVLCTDGATGALDDEALLAQHCRARRAEEACRSLVASARERDPSDDASAIVLRIRERFVRRDVDAGLRARDLGVLGASPLFADLEPAAILAVLAAGVEVELGPGEPVPAAAANDRVAYVVLDGELALDARFDAGRRLGESGLVHAESLLDVTARAPSVHVVERARLLRLRHDDFREICRLDAGLAAALYERLARHLAAR
jgi:serine/threonine protein phosphatase PrpC